MKKIFLIFGLIVTCFAGFGQSSVITIGGNSGSGVSQNPTTSTNAQYSLVLDDLTSGNVKKVAIDTNGWKLYGVNQYTFNKVAIGTRLASYPFQVQGTQSTAPLGVDQATNGSFDTQGHGLRSWILTGADSTGWAWTTGKAVHSSGTNALKQNITVITASNYIVTFTVTGMTTGTLTCSLGAFTTALVVSASGDYAASFITTSSGAQTLTFTPTTGFNGSIDNITIKRRTSISTPDFVILNSDGTVGVTFRSGGSGLNNSFNGYLAGGSNTFGSNNLFSGWNSGSVNSIGSYNVFIGPSSGRYNQTGGYNVFLGTLAGEANTTGSSNVFIGYYSGSLNLSGTGNTAVGSTAGKNTTGLSNSFFGSAAGFTNGVGNYNCFFGNAAGYSNTGGLQNVFMGLNSGRLNSSGNYNTFVGTSAGYTNSTGSNNVGFGYFAGYYETGSNHLWIDNLDRTTLALGIRKSLIYGTFGADSSVQSIRINGYLKATGTTSSTGTAMVMGTDGRIYMQTSSERFKKNIIPLKINFKQILNVKPVSYQYTQSNAKDIGYIAEEFEKLGLKDLLNYDAGGKPFSIKYDKLPLYIIEVLKDHEARLKALEGK
jgi:hypothetical protein